MSINLRKVRDPQDSLHLLFTDDGDLDFLFSSGNYYRAGQSPEPGLYRQIDGPRTVEIRNGEPLPASFDGHVAVYRRIESLWGQIEEQELDRAA